MSTEEFVAIITGRPRPDPVAGKALVKLLTEDQTPASLAALSAIVFREQYNPNEPRIGEDAGRRAVPQTPIPPITTFATPNATPPEQGSDSNFSISPPGGQTSSMPLPPTFIDGKAVDDAIDKASLADAAYGTGPLRRDARGKV